MQQALT